MDRKRRLLPLVLVLIVFSLIAGISARALAEEKAQETIAEAHSSVAQSVITDDAGVTIQADGSVLIPDGFPGVKATGPVPSYLETAAAAGNAGAQVAKYMWEHGAMVVPLGDGRYAIPMPKQIPPGITWPAEYYPAREVSKQSASSYVPVPPPLFLDPKEVDLWDQLTSNGVAFWVVQGDDGYVHIQKSGCVP